MFDRWTEATLRGVAEHMDEDRVPRNPATRAEDASLGGGSNNRVKRVGAGDSHAVPHANMKVYLLRVSTLIARGADRYDPT